MNVLVDRDPSRGQISLGFCFNRALLMGQGKESGYRGQVWLVVGVGEEGASRGRNRRVRK